jgi:hypothetical protein
MEEGAIAIDLDVAAAELKATSLIQNEGVRRARMAEISAAALVDIATSLRVIANESAAAMLPAASVEYFEGEPHPGERIDDDGPRDFLLVGDIVHLVGETEPGEVESLGFDGDGNATASVNFGDGATREYYHSSLVRMVGDEGRDPELLEALIEVGDDPAGEISDEEEAADPDLVDLDAEADEPSPADLVDDIDADFEGEPHPAAESAVDVLRANEAARKAAKKAATKKGSKK